MTTQIMVRPDSRDLTAATTDDLRGELARGLTLTADTLTRLGMVWGELERRGEDLSDLRHGLARTLPLIATGRLSAEAVVAFAGRPILLRALEGVPLEQQCRLATGEPVQVIDLERPGETISMPLATLPAAAVRVVFGDGEVRSPEAQRLAFRRRPKRKGEDVSAYRYRPRYDPETGLVHVGKMTVALTELLTAVAAAHGPARQPDLEIADEYVTVRVRLSKAEHAQLQRAVEWTAKDGMKPIPDWELIRKAMIGWGVIGR